MLLQYSIFDSAMACASRWMLPVVYPTSLVIVYSSSYVLTETVPLSIGNPRLLLNMSTRHVLASMLFFLELYSELPDTAFELYCSMKLSHCRTIELKTQGHLQTLSLSVY